MSDRLLSGKQIVGTSIFLLIGLLYLTTGFQVETGELSLPSLSFPELFKDKCGEVSPDKIKPCKIARSYEEILSGPFGIGQIAPSEGVVKSKLKIDNIPCDKLSSAYDNNLEWNLRDYVAWRYVYEC